MKVIYEAEPGGFVIQENTGYGWESLGAYKFPGDAIEAADELAIIFPRNQYRVIDTKEET